MASYYYFATTLPLLRLDRPMPLSLELFLTQAKEHLNTRDWETLHRIVHAKSHSHALAKNYQSFVTALNRSLAKVRLKNLGFALNETLQAEVQANEFERLASELVGLTNPLEAELKMLTLQWKKIEELVGLKVFEFDALVGYALKLLILQRVTTFTQEVGQATFETLLGTLRSEIDQM